MDTAISDPGAAPKGRSTHRVHGASALDWSMENKHRAATLGGALMAFSGILAANQENYGLAVVLGGLGFLAILWGVWPRHLFARYRGRWIMRQIRNATGDVLKAYRMFTVSGRFTRGTTSLIEAADRLCRDGVLERRIMPNGEPRYRLLPDFQPWVAKVLGPIWSPCVHRVHGTMETASERVWLGASVNQDGRFEVKICNCGEPEEMKAVVVSGGVSPTPYSLPWKEAGSEWRHIPPDNVEVACLANLEYDTAGNWPPRVNTRCPAANIPSSDCDWSPSTFFTGDPNKARTDMPFRIRVVGRTSGKIGEFYVILTCVANKSDDATVRVSTTALVDGRESSGHHFRYGGPLMPPAPGADADQNPPSE